MRRDGPSWKVAQDHWASCRGGARPEEKVASDLKPTKTRGAATAAIRHRKEAMAETTTHTPVLDLLEDMTTRSIEASSLDSETLMLVRIAALVAVDAPPASYLLNLGAANELEIDADKVQGVIAAVAPIVGTTRVVSALSKIARALELELDITELEALDKDA